LWALQTPAAAEPRQPRIVIVKDDAASDAVPRDSRNFNRAVREIAQQLLTRRFQVFDASFAHLEMTGQDGRRRTIPELMDAAGAHSPPMDVLVVLQFQASVRRDADSDTRRPQIKLAGVVMSVLGNKEIGRVEAGGDITFAPLPDRCDNRCASEQIGEQANVVASRFGAALAEQLDPLLTR
jgi:hypothetical protein